MSHDLSAEQRQAIEERGGNLLVAAGAGSGKTTVLAERVLSHVCGERPIDIDRLLVLTFTNAAAAEMRGRIEDNLARRLLDKPGDPHLMRQLALVQQAPITTIHAFCLDLLRRHFYLVGLDAGFSIPSDMERAILHEETLAAFLEREYAKDEGILTTLAASYGGRRDDKDLIRLIGELYAFSLSQPHPADWLREAAVALAEGEDLDSYVWSDFLLRELKQELAAARRSFAAARELAAQEDIPYPWLRQTESEIEDIDKMISCEGGLAGFCAALAGLSFAALSRASQGGSEAAKEEFRRLRDEGKSAVKELKEHFGRRAPQDMLADLCALAPLMERLCNLVIDYGAALDGEKRRRNLLDFDDMEHFCLRLLEDDANGVAASLRERFDELLIDEYQDINAVQERILRLLSRGDNVFAVGDVKQSIYRFRLAEPALFLHKYREYGQKKGGLRIDLNRNYRSKGGIITAVNYLFSQLMSMSSSELDYDETNELKAGQEDFGANVELWLVDRGSADSEEEDTAADVAKEDPSASASEEEVLTLEARLLGRRIRELQKEGYGLKDMAVLLRAAKNRETLLVKEFADMGIAAVAGSRPDYLQSAEISLVLALLAIIDNPLQEMELATVLRSPLYGFNLDELFQIRRAAPAEQLYDALILTAQGEGEAVPKCRLFLEQLTAWRESLRRLRISELLGDIYAKTSLMQLAGALPGGSGRQENLLLLQERAREYEATGYRGLFRFLLFLADGRGKGASEGLQLAEGEDAVRVMSIHRSKGLEFPVVMVANLGGAFTLLDERKDIMFHKELGLGPKVVEREQRRKFPSLAQEAMTRRLHKEALAEEMRVLYVALTRARERLILSGALKDVGKSAAAWYAQVAGQGKLLNGELLLRNKRALDWLGQALLRHPQAGVLRRAAGITPGSPEERRLLIQDSSAWYINIVPEHELKAAQQPAAAEEADYLTPSGLLPASPHQQGVEEALSYKYPYREACEAAAKWTVTDLSHWQNRGQLQSTCYDRTDVGAAHVLPNNNNHPPRQWPDPRLEREEAARRGMVQHKLLQYLDFAGAVTVDGVLRQLDTLTERKVLQAGEAELVDTAKIARFAASKLGSRLAVSTRVLRETSFTYALPAPELVSGAAPQDKLVLQGIIDAAFWEEDGWVLLDYKTGGAGLSGRELKERYTAQASYYCRALQDIWQETVKEAWLCFLDLGENIQIEDW